MSLLSDRSSSGRLVRRRQLELGQHKLGVGWEGTFVVLVGERESLSCLG